MLSSVVSPFLRRFGRQGDQGDNDDDDEQLRRIEQQTGGEDDESLSSEGSSSESAPLHEQNQVQGQDHERRRRRRKRRERDDAVELVFQAPTNLDQGDDAVEVQILLDALHNNKMGEEDESSLSSESWRLRGQESALGTAPQPTLDGDNATMATLGYLKSMNTLKSMKTWASLRPAKLLNPTLTQSGSDDSVSSDLALEALTSVLAKYDTHDEDDASTLSGGSALSAISRSGAGRTRRMQSRQETFQALQDLILNCNSGIEVEAAASGHMLPLAPSGSYDVMSDSSGSKKAFAALQAMMFHYESSSNSNGDETGDESWKTTRGDQPSVMTAVELESLVEPAMESVAALSPLHADESRNGDNEGRAFQGLDALLSRDEQNDSGEGTENDDTIGDESWVTTYDQPLQFHQPPQEEESDRAGLKQSQSAGSNEARDPDTTKPLEEQQEETSKCGEDGEHTSETIPSGLLACQSQQSAADTEESETVRPLEVQHSAKDTEESETVQPLEVQEETSKYGDATDHQSKEQAIVVLPSQSQHSATNIEESNTAKPLEVQHSATDTEESETAKPLEVQQDEISKCGEYRDHQSQKELSGVLPGQPPLCETQDDEPDTAEAPSVPSTASKSIGCTGGNQLEGQMLAQTISQEEAPQEANTEPQESLETEQQQQTLLPRVIQEKQESRVMQLDSLMAEIPNVPSDELCLLNSTCSSVGTGEASLEATQTPHLTYVSCVESATLEQETNAGEQQPIATSEDGVETGAKSETQKQGQSGLLPVPKSMPATTNDSVNDEVPNVPSDELEPSILCSSSLSTAEEGCNEVESPTLGSASLTSNEEVVEAARQSHFTESTSGNYLEESQTFQEEDHHTPAAPGDKQPTVADSDDSKSGLFGAEQGQPPVAPLSIQEESERVATPDTPKDDGEPSAWGLSSASGAKEEEVCGAKEPSNWTDCTSGIHGKSQTLEQEVTIPSSSGELQLTEIDNTNSKTGGKPETELGHSGVVSRPAQEESEKEETLNTNRNETEPIIHSSSCSGRTAQVSGALKPPHLADLASGNHSESQTLQQEAGTQSFPGEQQPTETDNTDLELGGKSETEHGHLRFVSGPAQAKLEEQETPNEEEQHPCKPCSNSMETDERSEANQPQASVKSFESESANVMETDEMSETYQPQPSVESMSSQENSEHSSQEDSEQEEIANASSILASSSSSSITEEICLEAAQNLFPFFDASASIEEQQALIAEDSENLESSRDEHPLRSLQSEQTNAENSLSPVSDEIGLVPSLSSCPGSITVEASEGLVPLFGREDEASEPTSDAVEPDDSQKELAEAQNEELASEDHDSQSLSQASSTGSTIEVAFEAIHSFLAEQDGNVHQQGTQNQDFAENLETASQDSSWQPLVEKAPTIEKLERAMAENLEDAPTLESAGSTVEISFEALQSFLLEQDGSLSSVGEQEVVFEEILDDTDTEKSCKSALHETEEPLILESQLGLEGEPCLEVREDEPPLVESSGSTVEMSFEALQAFLFEQEVNLSASSGEHDNQIKGGTIDKRHADACRKKPVQKEVEHAVEEESGAQEKGNAHDLESSASTIEISFEALQSFLNEQGGISSENLGHHAEDASGDNMEIDERWKRTTPCESYQSDDDVDIDESGNTTTNSDVPERDSGLQQAHQMVVAVEEAQLASDNQEPTILESIGNTVEISFEALQKLLFAQDANVSPSRAFGRIEEANEDYWSTAGEEMQPDQQGDVEAIRLKERQADLQSPSSDSFRAKADEGESERQVTPTHRVGRRPEVFLRPSQSFDSDFGVAKTFETLQAMFFAHEPNPLAASGHEHQQLDVQEMVDDSIEEDEKVGRVETHFPEAVAAKDSDTRLQMLPEQLDEISEVLDFAEDVDNCPLWDKPEAFEQDDDALISTISSTSDGIQSSASEYSESVFSDDPLSSSEEPNDDGASAYSESLSFNSLISGSMTNSNDETASDSGSSSLSFASGASSLNFASTSMLTEEANEDTVSEGAGSFSRSSSLKYISSTSTRESHEESSSLDDQPTIQRTVSLGSGQLMFSDSENEESSFQGLQVVLQQHSSEDSIEGLQVFYQNESSRTKGDSDSCEENIETCGSGGEGVADDTSATEPCTPSTITQPLVPPSIAEILCPLPVVSIERAEKFEPLSRETASQFDGDRSSANPTNDEAFQSANGIEKDSRCPVLVSPDTSSPEQTCDSTMSQPASPRKLDIEFLSAPCPITPTWQADSDRAQLIIASETTTPIHETFASPLDSDGAQSMVAIEATTPIHETPTSQRDSDRAQSIVAIEAMTPVHETPTSPLSEAMTPVHETPTSQMESDRALSMVATEARTPIHETRASHTDYDRAHSMVAMEATTPRHEVDVTSNDKCSTTESWEPQTEWSTVHDEFLSLKALVLSYGEEIFADESHRSLPCADIPVSSNPDHPMTTEQPDKNQGSIPSCGQLGMEHEWSAVKDEFLALKSLIMHYEENNPTSEVALESPEEDQAVLSDKSFSEEISRVAEKPMLVDEGTAAHDSGLLNTEKGSSQLATLEVTEARNELVDGESTVDSEYEKERKILEALIMQYEAQQEEMQDVDLQEREVVEDDGEGMRVSRPADVQGMRKAEAPLTLMPQADYAVNAGDSIAEASDGEERNTAHDKTRHEAQALAAEARATPACIQIEAASTLDEVGLIRSSLAEVSLHPRRMAKASAKVDEYVDEYEPRKKMLDVMISAYEEQEPGQPEENVSLPRQESEASVDGLTDDEIEAFLALQAMIAQYEIELEQQTSDSTSECLVSAEEESLSLEPEYVIETTADDFDLVTQTEQEEVRSQHSGASEDQYRGAAGEESNVAVGVDDGSSQLAEATMKPAEESETCRAMQTRNSGNSNKPAIAFVDSRGESKARRNRATVQVIEEPRKPFFAAVADSIQERGKRKERKASVRSPTAQSIAQLATKFGVTLRKTKRDENTAFGASASTRKERGELLVRELKHIQSHGPNMFELIEEKIESWRHQEEQWQEDIKKKRLSLRRFSSSKRRENEHTDDDSAAPVNGDEKLLMWGQHPTRLKPTNLIRELKYVHTHTTQGEEIVDSMAAKVKSWQREESKRHLQEMLLKRVRDMSLSSNSGGSSEGSGCDLHGDVDKKTKAKTRPSTHTTSGNTLSTRSSTDLGSSTFATLMSGGAISIDAQQTAFHFTDAHLITSPISNSCSGCSGWDVPSMAVIDEAFQAPPIVTPERRNDNENDEVTVHSFFTSLGPEEENEVLTVMEIDDVLESFDLNDLEEDDGEDDFGVVGYGHSDNVSVLSELTTPTIASAKREKPSEAPNLSLSLSTESTEDSTIPGKQKLQQFRSKLRKVAVSPRSATDKTQECLPFQKVKLKRAHTNPSRLPQMREAALLLLYRQQLKPIVAAADSIANKSSAKSGEEREGDDLAPWRSTLRRCFSDKPTKQDDVDIVNARKGNMSPRTPISIGCDSKCILDFDWDELDDMEDELDDMEDDEGRYRGPESIFRPKIEDAEPFNVCHERYDDSTDDAWSVADEEPLHVESHTTTTTTTTSTKVQLPATCQSTDGDKIRQVDGFYDTVSVSFLATSIRDQVIVEVMDEALRILRPGGVLNVLDLDGSAMHRIRGHAQFAFLDFGKATPKDQDRHETNTMSILEKSGLQTRFDANDPGVVHWTAVKVDCGPTSTLQHSPKHLTYRQVAGVW